MIPEPITQIGLLCAVVAVILDKLLPYVVKKNGNDTHRQMQEDLKMMKQQLARLEQDTASVKRYAGELHRWHDKEDEDGVKVWYVRQSLERAIERLADAASSQTKLLEEILRRQKESD